MACKVSGQEQLPFQTEKKKKEENSSLNHFKSGLSACEKAKFTAVGTKLRYVPSVTQRGVTGFLCFASSQLIDSDSVRELFGSCVNSRLL